MLTAIRKLLGGSGKPTKERRRLPAPGPCPIIGASLVKRNVVMKVTETPSNEFWSWLVLAGWREVRMSKNKRAYVTAPPGAFAKLARAAINEREELYGQMLGPMTLSK